MAKKTTEEGGCLGVTCQDGTCLACQVSQAARFHEAIVAAIKALAAEVGILRNTIVEVAQAQGQRAAPAAAPAQPTPAAAPAQPTPAAAPAQPTPAAAPAQPLTIEQVRPAVLEWIKANGRDKFVAVLAKFGAANLPAVKPADLPALLAELKK